MMNSIRRNSRLALGIIDKKARHSRPGSAESADVLCASLGATRQAPAAIKETGPEGTRRDETEAQVESRNLEKYEIPWRKKLHLLALRNAAKEAAASCCIMTLIIHNKQRFSHILLDSWQ